jgi:TPR repeat protein
MKQSTFHYLIKFYSVFVVSIALTFFLISCSQNNTQQNLNKLNAINDDIATPEATHGPKLKLARIDPFASKEFDQALLLLEQGKYEEARALLQPLAGAGYSDAELYIAYSYYPRLKYNPLPREIEPNKDQAIRWLKRAADNGHPIAQSTLSLVLEQGGPDFHVSPSQVDYKEVYKYLRLAAEQGFASAQLGLATAYQNGYGIEQSPVDAYMWFLLALNRMENTQKTRHTELTITVIESALKTMESKNQISPEQIKNAKKRASDWEKSHPDAYQTDDLPELYGAKVNKPQKAVGI